MNAGPETETVTEAVVLCDARAAQCRCTKPAGHVEDGDPAHLCTSPAECQGSWRGDFDSGKDFQILSLPQARWYL